MSRHFRFGSSSFRLSFADGDDAEEYIDRTWPAVRESCGSGELSREYIDHYLRHEPRHRKTVFFLSREAPLPPETRSMSDAERALRAHVPSSARVLVGFTVTHDNDVVLDIICGAPWSRGTRLGAAILDVWMTRARATRPQRELVLAATKNRLGFYYKAGFASLSNDRIVERVRDPNGAILTYLVFMTRDGERVAIGYFANTIILTTLPGERIFIE